MLILLYSHLFTNLGTGVLPNSLLHLKRWGNHLHSFKISTTDNEIEFPDFRQHPNIATLQEAFQVIKGNNIIFFLCRFYVLWLYIVKTPPYRDPNFFFYF